MDQPLPLQGLHDHPLPLGDPRDDGLDGRAHLPRPRVLPPAGGHIHRPLPRARQPLPPALPKGQVAAAPQQGLPGLRPRDRSHGAHDGPTLPLLLRQPLLLAQRRRHQPHGDAYLGRPQRSLLPRKLPGARRLFRGPGRRLLLTRGHAPRARLADGRAGARPPPRLLPVQLGARARGRRQHQRPLRLLLPARALRRHLPDAAVPRHARLRVDHQRPRAE
mmetsp:Transcript_22838/g.58485  ORF Transcript_22838/g.58485 Transcript_22838/m.58485 type:complete len:219 (+) Transcript_22838:577-1233(+)